MITSQADRKEIPILEGRHLRVERGGVAVLDVDSLAVGQGEVLSLIGPNGAGKTTLLVTLCALAKTFQGEILFKGARVGKEIPADGYRRNIAMVFQEPLLFNTTVFDNVASGLKYRKVRRSVILETVNDNLGRFGIAHLADRSARTLSGGEAQRVSLARAFALNPQILFLDEPFSALDPPTRESLVSDFENALKLSGATALFATHDRTEALRLSDRIAVMSDGRILQTGDPEEVMNRPADQFVAAFVGVETILKGRVLKAKDGVVVVSVAGHEMEAVGCNLPDEHVILCIRPENVTLSRYPSGEKTSARNVFSGTIRRVTALGLYFKVELDCGFPLVAFVTKQSLNEMSLSEGRQVEASFKATAVFVLKTKC